MEFLKRISIAAALFIGVLFILQFLGVDPESAKFEVIALLIFWGLVFLFLHPYLPFIGLLETLPQRGFAEDTAPRVVWKFLAILFFIIAGLCSFLWK